MVIKLPLTTRSDDSVDGAGFGLAATGAGDGAIGLIGLAGTFSDGASAFSLPSCGLVLENIASYPYISHWINRLAIEVNFIV